MPVIDSVKYGTIVPSFDRGSLLLVSGHDQVRVIWNGERKAAQVPVGKWNLRNYKIEKKHEGVEWLLSGSGVPGPEVEVKENEETKVEIDETVHLSVSGKRMHGKLQLGFNVTGHKCMGLTVVRDEARPAPKWKIARGEEDVASGEYRYG